VPGLFTKRLVRTQTQLSLLEWLLRAVGYLKAYFSLAAGAGKETTSESAAAFGYQRQDPARPQWEVPEAAGGSLAREDCRGDTCNQGTGTPFAHP